ncbi:MULTISPECIES: hypothetical protein [Paenibacillus]|uniref:Uncharacterized protein n=1 Tax=Paenibacillus violae TaxID=3077234 RepID=A0ABU3RAY5_9BACL|nr:MULTISPECIES: hypothetical protein [Paenibacillus]MDU0201411.1 hypothetical protein [Paenibacillus sp. PFR10]MEC0269353.1 hypothetical protein [Paenibacillus anseongense]
MKDENTNKENEELLLKHELALIEGIEIKSVEDLKKLIEINLELQKEH